MDPQRQTASFLRQRFQLVGFRPQSRLGQNFLIDLNLLDVVLRAADIQPHDVVLEVGGGTGSLTTRLAQRAAAVVSVELDAQLAQLAAEQLAGMTNVTLLQQDALRNKNHMHPLVMAAVRAQLQSRERTTFKLVANLPYSVATPVISNMLASEIVPDAMTVMIQKELADRIVAVPRTKEYGSLSVWVQSQCEAAIVRELPPSVFWPRPQVDSAIVQLVLVPAQRAQIGDPLVFQRFVRGLFLHRRKFLRSALSGAFKELSKPRVDAAMSQLQLGPDARAEQLSVSQILELARACGMVCGSRRPVRRRGLTGPAHTVGVNLVGPAAQHGVRQVAVPARGFPVFGSLVLVLHLGAVVLSSDSAGAYAVILLFIRESQLDPGGNDSVPSDWPKAGGTATHRRSHCDEGSWDEVC